MDNKSKFIFKKGVPLPLGTTKIDNAVNFSVAIPNTNECKLNIYYKDKNKLCDSIFLNEEYKTGDIFSVYVSNFDYKDYVYTFEVMNKEFCDPYARRVYGREIWGKPYNKKKNQVRCGFDFDIFDWSDDVSIDRPFKDEVIYRVHMRGFSCSKTSKVTKKGTFAGFSEKIPYLKDLGINSVLLLPIYEFDEILIDKNIIGPADPTYIEYSELEKKQQETTKDPVLDHYMRMKAAQGIIAYKVNYWGFSDECSYFAPKSSFAYNTEEAATELKTLIKKLHQADIEVLMDFNFTYWTNKQLIIDCLRFWKTEYHIDGFRVNNNVAPLDSLATDPLLGNTKLITDGWNINGIYKEEYIPNNKNLAELNDGFLVDVRRFIKGDEALTNNFAYRFRRNATKNAIINYVTDYNGFSLNDVYSYDVKHNEANGESNRDGTDYNYCWNCGFEGPTRRQKVMQLRKKMIKNALLTMILSQGTPMLLGGDELLNSQKGNNNAYCQDNETSWINWNMNNANKEIFEFTKQLIEIRKNHPILRMNDELKVRDYVSCGYPDISYHGTKAWFPDFSNYSRTLGIMLCGEYAVISKTSPRRGINSEYKNNKDNYFYLAYNMHWEPHEFDLPKLPEGMEWEILINTHTDKKNNEDMFDTKSFEVKERSIIVFISKKKKLKAADKKTK